MNKTEQSIALWEQALIKENEKIINCHWNKLVSLEILKLKQNVNKRTNQRSSV